MSRLQVTVLGDNHAPPPPPPLLQLLLFSACYLSCDMQQLQTARLPLTLEPAISTPCLQDLGTALRRDVNGALSAAGAEEAAALGRLEARLVVSCRYR